MTFTSIINYVDKVHPNPYDEATKLRWLCEADGLVRSEILRQTPSEVPDKVIGTQHPVASYPYIRLYSYYLFAMMDFLSGDYDRYSISSELFEKGFESFAKWYKRGEASHG